jgi:2-keto-3-deoxy-L-rhamnonate aldolase RhmA
MVMGGFATGIGAFQYRPHGPRRVVSNTCKTMEGYWEWFRDADRAVGLSRSSASVAATTIIAAIARLMGLDFITISLSRPP